MKIFALVLGCLLSGYLLGGWGPRAELKTVREDMAVVREQLNKQVEKRRSGLMGVRQILAIPERSEASESTPVVETEEPVVAEEVKVEAGAVEATNRPPRRPGRNWRRGNKSFEEQINLAVEAWELRSQLARSTFIGNADLDDDETTRFNVLVESMNLRIGNAIAGWAERIEQGEVVGEEAGVRIMNEITGAIALTYDEMNRNMPEGWRENAGDRFTLSSMIDPRVAMPLAGLEDRLDFE